MISPRTILKLRRNGIRNPVWTYQAAQKAGVHLSLACAFLEEESAKGLNVFGHDPSIFSGAGWVTKAKYQEYKRQRIASGNRAVQGVGPMQLTYWTLQDEADKRGGCWRPYPNILTGLLHVASLIEEYGEREGIRRYNGSGPAAERYADQVQAKAQHWHRILTSK